MHLIYWQLHFIVHLFFLKKFKFKSLIILIFFTSFLANYLYGEYILNNNKQIQKYVNENKFINIKIVSPNFELKYNLSDKETLDRVKRKI